MPQIAQQDYIRIPIANLESLTNEEIAMIKKHIQNNTIWDMVLEIPSGEQCRPISVIPSGKDACICVYSDTIGGMKVVALNA